MNNAILKKGFIEQKAKDNPAYTLLNKNGNMSRVWTCVSHGTKSKDLNNKLMKSIYKELILNNKKELIEFYNRTLTEKKYREILLQQGIDTF